MTSGAREMSSAAHQQGPSHEGLDRVRLRRCLKRPKVDVPGVEVTHNIFRHHT